MSVPGETPVPAVHRLHALMDPAEMSPLMPRRHAVTPLMPRQRAVVNRVVVVNRTVVVNVLAGSC